MSFIRTELAERIGTIAFDNYAKRNALSGELIEEVIAALERLPKAGARAVVLRSALTETVWSSGHDVAELPHADVDPLPYDDPLEQLLRAVKTCPAPVIAMVHGSVWGGACELVMACDLVLADESASFAITPAKLGLPYNAAGILTFMSRLPLNVVKEMFFTAEPIPAARAAEVGILNHLVAPEELESRTYALARVIATRSSAAIAAFKEAMRVMSEAVAVSPSTYEYLHSLRRNVYFGPDYEEGLRAFREKRPAAF